MRGDGWFRRGAAVVTLVATVMASSSCGTLMHPERKGQTGGRVDAGIAILDGLGLLFFIIPGVIAFAVDFSNGTIYLPPDEARGLQTSDDLGQMVAIHVEPQTLTPETIERIVAEHTGRRVDLQDGRLVVVDPGDTQG